ncbi:MAG: hypothetical protein K2X82_34080 [Gemmataceae bacterium]|nr:hypothetical protein [Gemmataceae bacterium]
MSIVRVGMAEDKKFKDGYDAIFKKAAGGAKKPAAAKKPAGKKGTTKAKKK